MRAAHEHEGRNLNVPARRGQDSQGGGKLPSLNRGKRALVGGGNNSQE
jgi:hypothetical protein